MANMVEKIAESVKSLGLQASYGDAVTVGGAEIVPVSLVWFGFGGGSDGAAGDSGEEAAGGGGGGASIPIGAYVGEAGQAVFRPNIVALLWVLVPLTWVAGKSLSLVIKALKK